MTCQFVAYIDEAGDEGFGKLRSPNRGGQSHWLMLGACLVRHESDLLLPTWRNEIMSAFPNKRSRDLHFRHLNHDQKVFATNYISGKKIGACVVMSNKQTIIDSNQYSIFKQKQHLYNYLVRFLLERLTAQVASVARRENLPDCKLKVVFSQRSGTNYQVMNEYLALMRDGNEVKVPKRSINWNILEIKNIKVEVHSKWAGLQFADVITSAVFAALEKNMYGLYEHRYGLEISNNFIADNSQVLDCGLILIPPLRANPLDKNQLGFFEKIEKKRQVPGT